MRQIGILLTLTLALPFPLIACDKGSQKVISMQNPTDQKEKVFGLARRNSESLTYPTSLDFNDQFQIGDATFMKYTYLYWCQGYKGSDSMLAHTLSENYRNEDDSFKKQDILKSLKPQLEAYKNNAQKLGNIKITTFQKVVVTQYDHEKNNFKFNSPSVAGIEVKIKDKSFPPQTYYSNILLGSLPYKMEYKPKSEAEARQIEGELTKLKERGSRSAELLLTVYGYVLQTYAMDDGRQLHSVIAVDSFSLDNPKTKQPIINIQSSLLPPVLNLEELSIGGDIKDAIINRFKIPKSTKEIPKGVPHFW